MQSCLISVPSVTTYSVLTVFWECATDNGLVTLRLRLFVVSQRGWQQPTEPNAYLLEPRVPGMFVVLNVSNDNAGSRYQMTDTATSSYQAPTMSERYLPMLQLSGVVWHYESG